MSDQNKSSSTGIGVGSSSILVVFVVLCLTTFATLSLVSANADYKLTAKVAENTTAYYAADAKAEEQLAVLADCLDKSTPETVLGALTAAGFAYITRDGQPAAGFDVAISPEKKLHVEVELATLKRLCWQVQLTQPKQPAQSQGMGTIGNLPSM